MNTTHVLPEAWDMNPAVLAAAAVVATGSWMIFRGRMRWAYFGPAIAVALIALISPLNALANGVLFSAHMVQHILLLLIVPALFIAGLPRDFSLPQRVRRGLIPALTWTAGVGSMWLWHVPALCDAAATSGLMHAAQTFSLLVMGALFWWPILAPRGCDRLAPAHGIIYLFTACLACTALGILLTFTTVEVCPVFQAPLAGGAWARLRDAVGVQRDREIGGLLMWVPMCLVYLSAIFLELSRWMAPNPVLQEKRS